ncbi:NADH:ubiquinone oxidoreductase [Desulfurella sp.]|uniref:NADH:ubiquinone oxidoreductase n=1 Tax=Desulfurella sp. TaxID=1962857 RepID=UPI003D10AC5B
MFLWPIYGLSKKYSKKFEFKTNNSKTVFKKSLHVFCIDGGSDVELLMEFYSLLSPKYNLHAYGIFFTNTPRHADVLVILSRPTQKMLPIIQEAISQMPSPYGVMLIENSNIGLYFEKLNLKNVVAHLKDVSEPTEILKKLIEIAQGGLIC